VIAITNNTASIQLNGDLNVTIIKKDVTKVVAIGVSVLVTETTKKTLIPYSLVTSPSTYTNAQALADYISSILGGFTVPITVENTDVSYQALATTNPFVLPDTTYNVYVNAVLDTTFTNPTLDPLLDINIS